MSTIYEQANMYDGEAGNQAGQLDPNYDGGGVTGMFGTFQPEAIDADQADLEEEAGLEDGDELDDPVEGEDGEVPEDGVVPTAEEGRLGADEVVGGGAQDFVQRGGNPRYKTDLSEAYAPKFKRNSPYDTVRKDRETGLWRFWDPEKDEPETIQSGYNKGKPNIQRLFAQDVSPETGMPKIQTNGENNTIGLYQRSSHLSVLFYKIIYFLLPD